MLGCTSPTAKNYNSAATEDDGSCIWLDNIEGTCYQFDEVPAAQILDHSFTVSMALKQDSMEPEGWVYFHDYFPDAYVHTRDKLLNLKTNTPFYHSKGLKGIYHFNTVPKPYFIDVLFADKNTMVLNSINWLSEVRATGNDPIDDNKRALYLETLTSITIWNQYQTTGKITLDGSLDTLQRLNNRGTEENWSFNSFRDVLDNVTDQFVLDLFGDYRMDETKLNTNLAWWEQRLMEGKYFIIRFEFDNNNNKQITLFDMGADISKSYR
jgi:hypothetical protein